MMVVKRFRVVQPWGKDVATESTVVSTHDNAVDAFAEIDRMAEQMLRTSGSADLVRLVVVDESGKEVRRPNAS